MGDLGWPIGAAEEEPENQGPWPGWDTRGSLVAHKISGPLSATSELDVTEHKRFCFSKFYCITAINLLTVYFF